MTDERMTNHSPITPERFLGGHDQHFPWDIPDSAPKRLSLAPVAAFTGHGRQALEVALATAPRRPGADDLRRAWVARQGRAASPLLLVIAYKHDGEWTASICGPVGDDPPSESGVALSEVERIAAAALAEPNRHAAIRFLGSIWAELETDLPGLQNRGMFASHELREGLPVREDWNVSCERGLPLLEYRGRELVERLGFAVETHATAASILSITGSKRAVAVFLDEGEDYEASAKRFLGSTPVSHALAMADREGLPWVVITRGNQIRVYSARGDIGVGRKGRSETYVEANLALLPDERAGYLTLLFSADALKCGGTFDAILEESRDYSTDLGDRLRERVYNEVVPKIALALASRRDGNLDDAALSHVYQQALTVLFRLLFVAYAEDKDLLPYRSNGAYRRRALKTVARALATRVEEGAGAFDPHATDLWDSVSNLWRAVDVGHVEWGVPAYNGGLFSGANESRATGPQLAQLRFTNAEFGPALVAMLVDKAADGVIGPVDFRSLSVREFGTIYEGLLESSLSLASEDLTIDSRGAYVAARPGDQVEVTQGDVYFHDRSGARKATGSYFTKHFAVEHLLEHSLEPALDDHIAVLEKLLEEDEQAKAADAFFDFRCIDPAMGSGHFLVAAVDRIEARLSAFLALHPLPKVAAELDRLRASALSALGALGEGVDIERSALLRRQVARRCVYGVDVSPIAVELARLGLWIHTFIPGLPLSFLDHSLVCGDSLTGIGTLDEATSALDPENSPGQASLFRGQIDAVLGRAEGALARLANVAEASIEDITEAQHAQQQAADATRPVRELFDLILAARLGEAAPLHAFDESAIAKNAQRDKAESLREELHAVHFPIAFPEVFVGNHAGFDCVLGNPPWQEATVEELGFWALRFPGLKGLAQVAKREMIGRLREERPDLVTEYEREVAAMARLRESLLTGPYPGMGTGDPDLYKAFAWRFFALARKRGRIGIVLPHSIFATKGSAPWRQAVLSHSEVDVDMCRNVGEWLFTDVNPGYSIDLVSVAKDVGAPSLSVGGIYRSNAEYRAGERNRSSIPLPALEASDDLLCVPALRSPREARLFAKLIQLPRLGDLGRPDFGAVALTELHATKDRYLFAGGPDSVYNHRNIGHFAFEPGRVFAQANFDSVAGVLQERRLRSLTRNRSPLAGMPPAWAEDELTLPCRNPRIAFRDVVHATNPRKVWAALVPARTLLTNKAPYLVFRRGDVVVQSYLLGILGSSVVDWFGHLRVVLNLNFFIFYAIPVPRFHGQPEAVRIAELSARLANPHKDGTASDWLSLADDDDVSDEERQAEIDALASLLFGLTDDELDVIWTDEVSGRPRLAAVQAFRRAWSSRSIAAA